MTYETFNIWFYDKSKNSHTHPQSLSLGPKYSIIFMILFVILLIP